MFSSKIILLFLIILCIICSFKINSEQLLHSPLTQYINENVQARFNYLNFFEASPITNLKVASNNLKEPPIERAKYFSLFASAVYCSRNLITWKCSACQKIGANVSFVTEVTNKYWNTKAFFAHDVVNKEIIVTFRGALNLQNFLGDYILEMVKPHDHLEPPKSASKYPIKIHSGFRSMTLSLYPQIVAILSDLLQKYPYHRVVIVGHSLGGGLATLTQFYLKYEAKFPDTRFELYTYGASRVGNQGFVDYFNNLNLPVARVVERGDLYSHFIPTFLGYLHHGNELFIYDINGSAKYCSRIVYEDSKCSNSLGPYYNSIDHLRYFDTYMTTCFTEEEPWEALLQFVFPIRTYLQEYMKPKYMNSMIQNVEILGTNSIQHKK